MPDIPTPGRLVELEYASISDRKMRGQLRNPGEIEKTVSTSASTRTYSYCFTCFQVTSQAQWDDLRDTVE